jgi:hypothetical protein
MSSLISFKLPIYKAGRMSNAKGCTRKLMKRIFFNACILLFFFSLCFLAGYRHAYAAEIRGPEIVLRNNSLFVSTALLLEDKYIQELKNGISKEFKFALDVFRVWKLWPDEFITGTLFVRTLKCDKVKMECTATSYDGNTFIEKRFKSRESMLTWAIRIDNIKLTDLRNLEPGVYYVRVTVDSAIRKLPPVIGYFMIFLPENEFTVKKNSSFFTVGPDQ